MWIMNRHLSRKLLGLDFDLNRKWHHSGQSAAIVDCRKFVKYLLTWDDNR